MKKMKTTILTSVALAACVSTQVFAQVKEDVITFALTSQRQSSVSTSTAANAGNWSQQPKFYKTSSTKVTQANVLQYIGLVLHNNAKYYSSSAKLVMVQGELSGFFNITPDLGDAFPNDNWPVDGYFWVNNPDSSTDLPNAANSSYVTLANGHHFEVNTISGQFPVGHLQPWGQIFVKDAGKSPYSAASPLCENVTYFFAMSVEECYDCFYMNSFISDATFKVTPGAQSGPPCCGGSDSMTGNGKDRYYLTLSFDNTLNNPYLNPASDTYVGVEGYGFNSIIPGDGIIPDSINEGEFYRDPIRSFLGKPEDYVARFTLNGIVTYTWNLKFLNKNDAFADFIGTASYPCNGYGFIGLYCSLLNGTVTFTEKAVNTTCCLDTPWYDNNEIGSGAIGGTEGWYGPGAEYFYDADTDSYDTVYGWLGTPLGSYATPMNVGASLTYHHNFNLDYPWRQNVWESGWPTPAIIVGEGFPL